MGSLRGAFSALGAGIGLAAVVAGLRSATKAALDFGTAMAEVSTLLPDDRQLGALTENARALALEFGKSPAAEAKSFYQIISAGAGSAAEATDILTAANKLAVGGITSVNIAADGLTSILNAYEGQIGTATDVSDALFVAMKAGKTTIGELSVSLGLVAPLAAAVGVDFDELAGSLAALTKGGINTRIAVTGVRAILAAVAKATEPVRKEAKGLGIDFSVAGLKAKGFAGFMKDLVDKTGGSAEVMGRLLGGVEALVPALALAGSAGDALSEIMVDMANKAGATEEAFTKMSDNAQFKMDKLRAAFAVLATDIGDSLLDGVVPATEALVENMDAVKNALAGAALAGGAGLFLTLGRAIFFAEGAVLGLNAAMRANPILAIVSLIGLATFAILEFRDATDDATDATKTHASALAELNRQENEAQGITLDLAAAKDAEATASKQVAASIRDEAISRRDNTRAIIEGVQAEALKERADLRARQAVLEGQQRDVSEGTLAGPISQVSRANETRIREIKSQLVENEELINRADALLRRIEIPPLGAGRAGGVGAAGVGGGFAIPTPKPPSASTAADDDREKALKQVNAFIAGLEREAILLNVEDSARAKVIATMRIEEILRGTNITLTQEQTDLLNASLSSIAASEKAEEDAAKAKEKAAEAQRKLNEVIAEGAAVFEATRTPLERYNDEIKRLGALQLAGAISVNTFNRAIQDAQKTLEDAEAEASSFDRAVEGLGFAFESAFEDAIVEGENLRDVINSLATDLRRLAIREFITKPLFGGLSDLIQGGTGGPLFEQIGGLIGDGATGESIVPDFLRDTPPIPGRKPDFDDGDSGLGLLTEAIETATTAFGGATAATDAVAAAGKAGADVLGGDLVKSTIEAVIGTAAETATSQTLVGALTQLTVAASSAAAALSAVGATSGAGGGLLSSLFAGGDGPGPLPTVFADVLHEGGVAGRSLTRAVVPAAAFARGSVAGPGGPRSDSILARLSDGEFVVNAESTRRFRGLLERINSGAKSMSALVPEFAAGGYMPAARRFADGGGVGFVPADLGATVAQGRGGATAGSDGAAGKQGDTFGDINITVQIPPGTRNFNAAGRTSGQAAAAALLEAMQAHRRNN